MKKNQELVSDKFTVRVIGDHQKVSSFDKAKLNENISRFLSDFDKHFLEGEMVIDIRLKKGVHNEGRYRKLPLVYANVRFSTDKGLYIAKKENWGVCASVHDALLLIKNQITKAIKRTHERERSVISGFDFQAVEA